MMVELTEEIIDVMNKIKDSIAGTLFEINHFRVCNTGAGGEMIELDIQRHPEEDK